MIKSIINAKLKDNWSDQIKKSYDIWIFYSKYEHLGWNSYVLTRNISKEQANERLRYILTTTIILLQICMEILNEQKGLSDSQNLFKRVIVHNT